MLDLMENRDMLALFDLCYTPRIDAMSGAANYDRIGLPVDGGVSSQPAKVMEALTIVEHAMTDELREDIRAVKDKHSDG